MFIAKNKDLIIMISSTKAELENALKCMVYTSVEETETEYRLYNGVYLTEEEIQKNEKECISKLKLTRGDVFRGLLSARGITRNDIRAVIESMSEASAEEKRAKELARIDFDEALEFYRGVELIDKIGEALGISSKQLDDFFVTNDWHVLISQENSLKEE